MLTATHWPHSSTSTPLQGPGDLPFYHVYHLMWGPTAYKPHIAVAHFTTDCDFLSIILRNFLSLGTFISVTGWNWPRYSQDLEGTSGCTPTHMQNAMIQTLFSSESQPNNCLTVQTKKNQNKTKPKNYHQMLLKLDLQETTSDQVPYST